MKSVHAAAGTRCPSTCVFCSAAAAHGAARLVFCPAIPAFVYPRPSVKQRKILKQH